MMPDPKAVDLDKCIVSRIDPVRTHLTKRVRFILLGKLESDRGGEERETDETHPGTDQSRDDEAL